MRILHLDCSMGAAGDMLAAALLGAYGDRDGFVSEMNALGIPGVSVSVEEKMSCGVAGAHFCVSINGETEGGEHHHGEHHHHNHGTHDIEHIVSHLNASDEVKKNVLAVYALIADAESRVHGEPVSEIHFHEVGALDAVADVAAVSLLMEKLAPDAVTASPVCVGGGTVKCAHGVLPVPAPATALLLEGIPSFGGDARMELCTPTGAALLRHFAKSFGSQPAMAVSASGCGIGTKEIPGRLNAVRAFLGETAGARPDLREFACTIDDMTPEAVGFAMERIFDAGALDVWTTPIGMKKCRPAVMLSCLCEENAAEMVRDSVLRHTTTLGVREYFPARTALERSARTVETKYGSVRVKSAVYGGGVREKAEYDDLARIARERGASIAEIKKELDM